MDACGGSDTPWSACSPGGISRAMVVEAIAGGEIIESYAGDFPLPSLLICGLHPKPLHVVLPWDADAGTCHIITAYRPDLGHFEPGFKRRRS